MTNDDMKAITGERIIAFIAPSVHSVVTQVLGAGGMERSKFQKTPKCSI